MTAGLTPYSNPTAPPDADHTRTQASKDTGGCGEFESRRSSYISATTGRSHTHTPRCAHPPCACHVSSLARRIERRRTLLLCTFTAPALLRLSVCVPPPRPRISHTHITQRETRPYSARFTAYAEHTRVDAGRVMVGWGPPSVSKHSTSTEHCASSSGTAPPAERHQVRSHTHTHITQRETRPYSAHLTAY